MKNPVVLITGALTGIGRAAAIIFAREGAQIVVSGRRDKQGQELVAELQGLGAEAIFVRTDVRKDEDVRNLVDQTVKRFGRLDVAVNNAGTEGTPGPVTEQTAETYAATFDTNVQGTLLSMKHEMPDRSHLAGCPSMHRHDCSRPGLVQLRLLALHHQTRNSPIRTGRDDRSPKFTPRFSHRFRSWQLVQEIPARPVRSNQS